MHASSPSTSPLPCIGLFDSGVGGLSVLDAVRRRLPGAPLRYVGDVAFSPYGERSAIEVLARCNRIVEHLHANGVRHIVVACNTATALGIDALRRQWPEITFVGIEPGVKPAALGTRNGRIAVMATPATAASARLRRLIVEFASDVHVHVQPCPGLATMIETGRHAGPELESVLAPFCDRMRAADVDTVVLGCTHYPFVAAAIQSLLGDGVTLIDTARAVAERVDSMLGDRFPSGVDRVEPGLPAPLHVLSTGASAPMSDLLRKCLGASEVRVQSLLI